MRVRHLRRPCTCIKSYIKNVKQVLEILIVSLLINKTDNRQGELWRTGRKSINIQYVVVLVKIMGKAFRGGGGGGRE